MAIERAEVKPNIIRFFRSAMFNMVRVTCLSTLRLFL